VRKGSNPKKDYSDKTQWHPAYYQALQIELEAYKNYLTYENEHHLTTQPLRLDVLVIKKDPKVKIEKNIGRIFRNYNIFELKSPEDGLTIFDYYKVMGYAYLYCYLEKVLPQYVTITLAFTVNPRILIEHLQSRPEITIEEKSAGIKYIHGENIQIQMIENKLLDPNENIWLRALAQEASVPIIKAVIQARKNTSLESGAYWYVVFRENVESLKGAMEEMGKPTFNDFLDEIGYVYKTEVEKVKQEKDATIILLKERVNLAEEKKALAEEEKALAEEEKLLSIKNMLQDGVSVELISKNFFIPIDRVKEIWKEIDENR
jgi:hypothetical protein